MSDPLFHHVAILGLGQMGASLALALKASDRVEQIYGYDLNPLHAELAKNLGAVDEITDSPEEAAADADLIVFAVPMGAYDALAERIAPFIKTGAVVSDIGSVKYEAVTQLLPHMPPHVHLLPAHPVAGSEKVGPTHARADFFHQRLFLITPPSDYDEAQLERLAQLWESLGAKVEAMPPGIHDNIYGVMSHLPQFAIYAAMPLLAARGMLADKAGVEYQRFIRIGRSDPQMWRDIFLMNQETMLQVTEWMQDALQLFATELQEGMEASGHSESERSAQEEVRLITAVLPRMIGSALMVTSQLMERELSKISDTPLRLPVYAAGGFHDATVFVTEEGVEDELALISRHSGFIIELLRDYLASQNRLVEILKSNDATALLDGLAEAQKSGKSLLETRH